MFVVAIRVVVIGTDKSMPLSGVDDQSHGQESPQLLYLQYIHNIHVKGGTEIFYSGGPWSYPVGLRWTSFVSAINSQLSFLSKGFRIFGTRTYARIRVYTVPCACSLTVLLQKYSDSKQLMKIINYKIFTININSLDFF